MDRDHGPAGPLPLTATNFTDLSRTPWAGEELAKSYKRACVAAASQGMRIGESWEFSCDPDFPSCVAEPSGPTLSELVASYPDAILSPAWRKFQAVPSCEILVKLLDAGQALSLQVHPDDGDPDLLAGECGKPESWLILKAAPGAGIYLGFKHPLAKDELARALGSGANIADLLHFVPVSANDFFDIAPGVPHAIGAGVTLLEPQRIIAGQTGKTYRMWDWNRAYNARGEIDGEAGKPRPLHVDASLRLVKPGEQVGESFVASLRRQPTFSSPRAGLELRTFPANPYYQVTRASIQRGSEATYKLCDAYAACIVLAGDVTLAASTAPELRLSSGQPALIPFRASPLQVCAASDADLVLVTPSRGQAIWL